MSKEYVITTVRLPIEEADRMYRVVNKTGIPQSRLLRAGLVLILDQKEREIALLDQALETP